MNLRLHDDPPGVGRGRPAPPPSCPDAVASRARWADAKLAGYDRMLADAVVELRDPRRLTPPERNALLHRLRKLNFVIYHCRCDSFEKSWVKAFGMQLGLNRLDRNPCADGHSISSVHAATDGGRSRYIPYTDRPLGWHTDGYYNAVDRTIRSFLLHCAAPAAAGGENALLDPEIVYLLVAELDPRHVAALSEPDALSIPPDPGQGADGAPARTGPVFSFDTDGALHMRYTARQRNICWNPRPVVALAAAALRDTIEQAGAYTLVHRLEGGQGIICNNVLHRRAGFVDHAHGPQRLMYRARYYDRVLGT